MHYVFGLILVGLGVVLIIKTNWFIENFGANAWAEAKLGTSGGTRLMYKLVGLVSVFLGFLAITNMISGFLNATVVKLFVR
ncbi:MAG: hypothetical protein ABIH87_04160 [bacterium]